MARTKEPPKVLDDGLPASGYLSTDEAAQHFGVDRSTVYKWMNAGLLGFLRVNSGGRQSVRRIGVHHIRQFRQRHEVEGAGA